MINKEHIFHLEIVTYGLGASRSESWEDNNNELTGSIAKVTSDMEKQLLSITSMNGDYCQFARYLEITKETSKSIYGEGIYGDTYRLVKQSGEVFVNGEKIADTSTYEID